MDKPAYHLICEKAIEGEQFVTSYFNSLFEIKKLVLVKNSQKDKHLVKEIIIVLNSQSNIEILQQPSIFIGETKVTCTEISPEQAEQLIRQNKTKLYVGNIPLAVDNIKLWKHFARFGSLDYTYIIKKPDRRAKGFGFIIYEERESFEKAIKAKHYIDGHRLICKIFLNKSQLTRGGLIDGPEQSEKEECVNITETEELIDHEHKRSAGSTAQSDKLLSDSEGQDADLEIDHMLKRAIANREGPSSYKPPLRTDSQPFQAWQPSHHPVKCNVPEQMEEYSEEDNFYWEYPLVDSWVQPCPEYWIEPEPGFCHAQNEYGQMESWQNYTPSGQDYYHPQPFYPQRMQAMDRPSGPQRAFPRSDWNHPSEFRSTPYPDRTYHPFGQGGSSVSSQKTQPPRGPLVFRG